MTATFIQLGAGSGDLDPTQEGRDGFSAFVKQHADPLKDRVLLVEANPHHLSRLKAAWADWPQAEFHSFGIVPDASTEGTTTFFYAHDDAPSFQLFSAVREHVKRHFPNSQILSTDLPSLSIGSFLHTNVGSEPIEMLAMDIEGLDGAVLSAIPWADFEIHRLSFEKLHLTETKKIHRILRSNGFVPSGKGLYYNGLDELWVRPTSIQERLHCFQSHLQALSHAFRVRLRLRTRLRQLFAQRLGDS